MPDFTALIRNETDDGWLRFHNPEQVISVSRADEVIAALDQVESLSEEGYTAIGYVSYEAAGAFDKSLVTHNPVMPLLLFGIFRRGEATGLPTTAVPVTTGSARTASELQLAPEIGRPEFAERLRSIKRELRAGNSYQVNLTHRLSGYCDIDPEQLFAQLYSSQPSKLALYLKWGDLSICSVSPELFFSLEDGTITMQPMKGTRPRGSTAAEDKRRHDELETSIKERAENLMIVDMIRNDLGRIAEPGSVTASELFQLLALPTVWQQVSTVQARTRASLARIFQAAFPCASITGAPKARTMAIIKQLETGPRGVYTGALGVMRPGRRAQFSVAIRTLSVNRRSHLAEYGVGGGIVWDSEVDSEWAETRAKAQVLATDSFQLLETMRFDPGRGIPRLKLHLKRLHTSAEYFGFNSDNAAIVASLKAFDADSPQRLRLLVAQDGSFDIQSSPIPKTREPVRLQLASRAIARQDRFLRHKTTQRQVYDIMRREVGDTDDVLLWNEQDELTETTIYNMYLEINGQLLTPPVSSGLLAGTYRQMLLDSGKARVRRLTKLDLDRADRLFVSNSVRGLCEAVLIRR